MISGLPSPPPPPLALVFEGARASDEVASYRRSSEQYDRAESTLGAVEWKRTLESVRWTVGARSLIVK